MEKGRILLISARRKLARQVTEGLSHRWEVCVAANMDRAETFLPQGIAACVLDVSGDTLSIAAEKVAALLPIPCFALVPPDRRELRTAVLGAGALAALPLPLRIGQLRIELRRAGLCALWEGGMPEDSEGLCTLLASHMRGWAFVYDPERKLFRAPRETAALLGLRPRQEDFPACFLSGGRLSEDHARGMADFFAAMGPDKPESSRAFLLEADSGPVWLEGRYTWMDGWALVTLREVGSDRQKELIRQVYLQSIQNMESGEMHYYELDLTADTVEAEFGALNAHSPWRGERSYQRRLERYAVQHVYYRDRERFTEALDREHLLFLAGRGVMRAECEYRRVGEGGDVKWTSAWAALARDPYGAGVHAVLALRDIDRRKQWEQDLHHQAQNDATTGVLNRKAFIERMRDSHPQGPGALVMVGVDHMEQINDVLGSTYGDKVLRGMGATLTALLREEDLLGRYGGAEFMVFLRDAEDRELLEERLRIIAASLRRTLERGIEVTASLGVALTGEDSEFDELSRKAHLALRAARQRGDGTAAFYRPEMELIAGRARLVPGRRPENPSRIFIRTFGYFEVFVADEPIRFQGAQSKELMALLVDRRGGFLSAEEAIACLWENESANPTTYARYRKVAMRLRQSLEAAGIGDIVESKNGSRRVVPEKFTCDYYEYMSGEERGGLFRGAYMSNYSWAENTLADLSRGEV